MLSEGDRYQQLELASDDLVPRTAPDAIDDGLDGWAFMMRTADRGLALLYFEQNAVPPRVGGLVPGARYRWSWFDPRAGLYRRDRARRGSRRRAQRSAFPGGRRSGCSGLGRQADARADPERSTLKSRLGRTRAG